MDGKDVSKQLAFRLSPLVPTAIGRVLFRVRVIMELNDEQIERAKNHIRIKKNTILNIKKKTKKK
jgi:hypothetical protein